MKNKLHLVPKTVRLTCTWVRTGDVKNPLTCVWVEMAAPRAVSTASADSEAGRLHLCA
jgi:hypothetical protein